MSFSQHCSWDNRQRKGGVKLDPATGKSWTRRIRWLIDEQGHNKLKFEDGELYKEVLCSDIDAKTMWSRFKEGQSIDDTISILGSIPPKAMESRRMADERNNT